MKALIELGIKGHYPLFDPTWIHENFKGQKTNLTGQDRSRAKDLIKRLSKQRTLERKKTVLIAANNEERQSFVKAFLKLVEGKILDNKPELQ